MQGPQGVNRLPAGGPLGRFGFSAVTDQTAVSTEVSALGRTCLPFSGMDGVLFHEGPSRQLHRVALPAVRRGPQSVRPSPPALAVAAVLTRVWGGSRGLQPSSPHSQ